MELFQNLGVLNKALQDLAYGLAFVFIAIAGYQFMTSEGKPEAVQRAKMAIIYASIGVAIAFVATMIQFK